MKIAVETCCRIAFANGNEEPAKGRQREELADAVPVREKAIEVLKPQM